MVLHLEQSQRTQLYNTIRMNSLCDRDIADIANCSKRTINRVRANIEAFGAPYALKVAGGRHSLTISHILNTLLDHLFVKPGLYLDEMTELIWDEFALWVSVDSIRRSLKARVGRSKSRIRWRVKEMPFCATRTCRARRVRVTPSCLCGQASLH